MNYRELKELYNEMQTDGFPEEKQGSFAYAIGLSNEISYHFELLRKAWIEGNDFSKALESNFERHHDDGLEFLSNQLKKEPDFKIQVNIVYLAARILNYKNRFSYYKKYCDIFLKYLTIYVNTPVEELRRTDQFINRENDF